VFSREAGGGRRIPGTESPIPDPHSLLRSEHPARDYRSLRERHYPGYRVGTWHLLNGREQSARQYFEKALAPPAQLTGFGAVAGYFELEGMKR
jgi:hypothetical protein